MPSTALTAPMCLLIRIPWVSGKCFTRFRTCRIGSPRGTGSAMASSTLATSSETTSPVFASSGIEGLLPEVAGAAAPGQLGAVPLRHLVQRRGFLTADVLGAGAAGAERAARGYAQQVGRQPLDRVQLLALL